MVSTVSTVAYLGLEARGVEVQCQLVPGLPNFIVVGLPDKAVAESRERVRNAIAAIGLSLPPKRITVNLSPADLLAILKRHFTTIKHAKPPASRKGSVEWYVVAQGFKGRAEEG